MAHFTESFNISQETLKKLENLPPNIQQPQNRRLTRSKTQDLQPKSPHDALASDDECVEASPNTSIEQNITARIRKRARNASKIKSIRKNKSDTSLGKSHESTTRTNSNDFSKLDVTIMEELLEVVEQQEKKFVKEKDKETGTVQDDSFGVFSENEVEGVNLEKPISTQDLADMEFSDWETSNIFQEPVKPLTVGNQMEVVESHEGFNIDNVSFVAEPLTDHEMKVSRKEVSHMIKEFYADDEPLNVPSTQITRNSQILVRQGINSTMKFTQEPLKPLTQASKPDQLASWGLPAPILSEYAKKGITKMFPWQVECLSNKKTLLEGANLVYSAPTSAGKTLVSEILMIKSVLEREKKAIFILPFISVVREKMMYLRDLLSPVGVRVEGFYGGNNPPGGFEACQVAVCTIEKANSIFNRLLEFEKVQQVGIIVVDEIHLISDPNRGYILELLLAKILYVSQKIDFHIQIVGMSATLPNLNLLCSWLNAQYFRTDFRPVELKEMIKIGGKIFSNHLQEIRTLKIKDFSEICCLRDPDNVGQLVVETVSEGCGVIVFCSSKDWCEKLALNLAEMIFTIGRTRTDLGANLREAIRREAIEEVRQELLTAPTGLDDVLAKCLHYACAFHHAGLTTEERDVIEAGFRSGALRILVATSTLSSGVNLPARRVLIRSPMFAGRPMNPLTYRQMIGRAGRTGKDTLGEAILICDDVNARAGKELLRQELSPIRSCLDKKHSGNLRRALLEIISAGMATTRQDIHRFFACTMIWAEKGKTSAGCPQAKKRKAQRSESSASSDSSDEENHDESVQEAIKFLLKYEFIRVQSCETTDELLMATRLGYACLASSMPPSDGFLLFSELQKSRQCFVLESELHAIYLVTPFSVCQQLPEIDWLHFLDLWERLPAPMRRVGELVGIKDAFLVRAMRGTKSLDEKLLQIHKRFYTALALHELVNETPLLAVSQKYKCCRGLLQSLQQMAASFAAIVASFCIALNWQLLSMIVTQFRERLYFGIHRDLIDLMRIPSLNAGRARALYTAGIENVVTVARTETSHIAKILYDCASFDMEGQRDGEADHEVRERNLLRKLYLTGKKDLTVEEAAKLIKSEARKFVEEEMGGTVNWNDEKQETIQETDRNSFVRLNSSVDEIPCSQSPGHADISTRRLKRMKVSRLKVITPKILHADDVEIFQEYCKKVLDAKAVAVTLVIEKNKKKETKIGAKLLNGEENTTESCEKVRVDEERILKGLAITCDGKEVIIVNPSHVQFIRKLFIEYSGIIHMWETREKLKILVKIIPDLLEKTVVAFQDPQIIQWLLSGNETVVSLHRVVMLHCPELEDLLTLPETPDHSQILLQAVAESCIVMKLKDLTGKLATVDNGRLLKFFRDVEMPIQVSLFRMETLGFPVNNTEMTRTVQECKDLLTKLEKKIFALHGKKLNLHSTRAVASAVGLKKDQKSVSTSKIVLQNVGTPLAKLILHHRSLTAIYSQTLYPLAKSVQSDERIHGVSSSLTQTGRIVMHEPNIQTVAKDFTLDIGDEEGPKTISCRRVFAPKTGNCIISADFCQLELRILIHFSQDPTLIQVIKSNCDLFRAVAARWHKIREAEVTDQMRHDTKQICYGIIYGMRARGLAQALQIDESSAKAKIEGFYRTYPAIRAFSEKVFHTTRSQGFVETISGRRRFLEDINSPDDSLRAQAERQALNTMIQGTAADIAKMALLNFEKCWSKLRSCLLPRIPKDAVKFILHLHDELIFEVSKEWSGQFGEILRGSMETAIMLSVPLRVKLKMGNNWSEMFEIPDSK
ncbi:DNA polymerase theta [Sergentomyia squamirostris]